jgi:hypothetical protein
MALRTRDHSASTDEFTFAGLFRQPKVTEPDWSAGSGATGASATARYPQYVWGKWCDCSV